MLFHTKNDTTCQFGQAVATVICDSTWGDDRITTLELVYPRYIHSELMTHRVFSRNASSSRATPINVLIDEVLNDPVFFDFVGCNKAGMVADEPLECEQLIKFKEDWYALGELVAHAVKAMSDKYGVHKQTLNRALEPWSRIRTLVTSTDWDNFFKLRLAPDAQPEMQSLAKAMKGAMELSTPVENKKHLPYVLPCEFGLDFAQKLSVARCARVSYGRLNGKEMNPSDDINLYERLMISGHMSPFEHVAFAIGDGISFDNYHGWMSLRHVLKNMDEEV